MLMRVSLQAQGVWGAVDPGYAEFKEDRVALAAILQAVSKEMLRPLAKKDFAKAAWDAIKLMRVGVDRVREAKEQAFRQQYEAMRFKAGETAEEFSLRLTSVVTGIRDMGGMLDDEHMIKKFLRVVPKRYKQVAVALEQLLDLKTMPIEELVGRLSTAERDDNVDDDDDAPRGNRLYLTEEEWLARMKLKDHDGSSSGSKSGGGGDKSRHDKPRSGGRGDRGHDNKSGGGSSSTRTRDRSKVKCFNCDKLGHYSKECRKPGREWREDANLVQVENEQPALLFAEVHQTVFLNEERVIPKEMPDDVWYFDTGASNHMIGNRAMFASLDKKVTGTVCFGDNSMVEIQGMGAVTFQCKNGEHRALTEVYYIPRLRSNIISLGQLEEGGCRGVLENGALTLFDAERQLLARVPRKNRMYTLSLKLATPVCLLTKADDEAWRWHERFGHLNFRSLHDMSLKHMVEGMPLVNHVEQFCQGCSLGKHHRAPFPRASAFRAERGFELVHGDLCGPITPTTTTGKRYFLLIVDDYSRYMWVEMLRSKDEAFKCFKKIKAAVENELDVKLKAFRIDREGEFNSDEFTSYCVELGIRRDTTAPYTPQQNGVVERRNRTVVEMARSMLKSKGVPAHFWAEAIKTAVHVLNRAPTRALDGMTPYEALYRRKPKVHYLRTFGCAAHVKKVGPGVLKLSDRSIPGVFIGYEDNAKAYRVYDPVAKKLYVSRDVVFEEEKKWNWETNTGRQDPEWSGTFTVVYTPRDMGDDLGSNGGTQEVSDAPGQQSPATPERPPPATPSMPTTSTGVEFVSPPMGGSCDSEGMPLRYRSLENLQQTTLPVDDTVMSDVNDFSGFCLVAAEEPDSVECALAEPNWRRAMEDEMSSIRGNETWEFARLPEGH